LWAVGNIHLGLIEIYPGFYLKETYNDHVDADNPKSGSDWITSFSSGIHLRWPFRQHTIQGNWAITIPRYAKQTEWNYNEHHLYTKGNFLFGRGGNQYILELTQLSVKKADAPELGEPRRKRRENHFAPKIKVNFKDNLRLDFGYELSKYRYDDHLDDRDENHYVVTMNIRIFPKTSAFFSTKRGWIEHGNSDNDSNFRINTWVVMVDLTHRISDFTTVTLGIDRGEREYSDSDQFKNYILNNIIISCNHQLTYMVRTNLDFTYEFDKYQRISRKDRIYSLGFGVQYQPKMWLFTNLGLQHSHRTTTGDNDGTDYNNTVFSLSIGLAL